MEGKSEKCGEYRVQSLTNYFEYLEESKRKKDKLKYEIVKKVLKK